MADEPNTLQGLNNVNWADLEKELGGSSAEEDSPSPLPTGDTSSESLGVLAPIHRPNEKVILAPEAERGAQLDVGYLLDVELQIMVEVGRRRVHISQLLDYTQGSIIELTRLVGEPLELTIHGRPIARGEVVVVNEKFALRITEILDPQTRLQQMRG